MEEKDRARLEMQIIEVLKSIFDPEIPVNIYDLGLIYNLDIQEDQVLIDMTLTSPNCPVADNIVMEVQQKVARIPNAADRVVVNLVWEPMWNKEMLSEAAKLELGIFD